MTDTTNASNDDATAPAGWTVTYQAALPAGSDPQPFMQRMLRAGMGGAQASMARADLDWTDAMTVQAWASAQPNAVLLHAYTTTVEAIEANQAAVLTFRQALAHLLTLDAVSLDALGFLHGSLTQGLTKAHNLGALASQLHTLCTARGMPLTQAVLSRESADLDAGAVITRATAQLHRDGAAAGAQILLAMQAITVLPPDVAPDAQDGRSPFEELQAVFSVAPA